MAHEDGQVTFLDQVACNPAQNDLPDTRMGESADREHIRITHPREALEHVGHRPRATRKLMHVDLEAVSREVPRNVAAGFGAMPAVGCSGIDHDDINPGARLGQIDKVAGHPA